MMNVFEHCSGSVEQNHKNMFQNILHQNVENIFEICKNNIKWICSENILRTFSFLKVFWKTWFWKHFENILNIFGNFIYHWKYLGIRNENISNNFEFLFGNLLEVWKIFGFPNRREISTHSKFAATDELLVSKKMLPWGD